MGVTGSTPTAVHLSPWPWLAVTGCAVVALAGAVAVLGAGRWSGPRSRYDAPAQTADDRGPVEEAPAEPTSDPAVDAGTTWDALSRGEDPTR